ncbi:MAG: S8 family peptidase [Coprobacillaceae bacterium]
MEKSIKEFINEDDIMDFHFIYDINFEKYAQNFDYVYFGKRLLGNHITGYVKEKDFDRMMRDFGLNRQYPFPSIMGLLARQSFDASGITQIKNQGYLGLDGSGVLMAFVDTGIDYTNDIFRHEDETTRIKYIWDQTIEGNDPDGYYFGSEYNEEMINQALASEDPYQIVPHVDSKGHGTFLASNACGKEIIDFSGVAPNTNIVVVKLRRARKYYLDRYVIPDTVEEAYESTDVMLGINYIFEKATELNMPVSICIGLGTSNGSHDGVSPLEEYINKLSLNNGICICTSAGKEGQSSRHTNGIINRQDKEKQIEITVGQNVRGFTINIWNTISDVFSIGLRSPTGEKVGGTLTKSGIMTTEELLFERTEVSIQYFYPVEQSGNQLSFVRIVNPTPGIWTLILESENILNGSYHMWLPIVSLCPDDVRFLAPKPEYTVVIPSTSLGGIACGAYNSINNSLYANSSWGPTRVGYTSPELVAPGVTMLGMYPDGIGTSSGTSIAAAVTAGACALILQWAIVNRNDISISTYRIKAYLIRGCNRKEGLEYPNNQWGFGTLDLWQTFNLLRNK